MQETWLLWWIGWAVHTDKHAFVHVHVQYISFHWAWASFQCLRWKIQNGDSGECGSHCEGVCCLIHSMDGEIVFELRQNEEGKNEIKVHVSWWQWRLGDVEGSHLTEQLTEREWRRPLTWLDRFRDAVLLPASWGNENIQPYLGNRRWSSLTNKLPREISGEHLLFASQGRSCSRWREKNFRIKHLYKRYVWFILREPSSEPIDTSQLTLAASYLAALSLLAFSAFSASFFCIWGPLPKKM